MFSADKVKCPKCQRHVMKKIMAATNGKCNNCGYTIANSMAAFVPKPRTTMDMITSLSA